MSISRIENLTHVCTVGFHYLITLQVEFEGMTGKIAFDDHGYRRDYTLDLIELGLNSEPAKVNSFNN